MFSASLPVDISLWSGYRAYCSEIFNHRNTNAKLLRQTAQFHLLNLYTNLNCILKSELNSKLRFNSIIEWKFTILCKSIVTNV